MADIKLSFAMTAYDRILPLITEEVTPDGVELDYQGMLGAVPRVFYEQIKFHRYDVSEMSMPSYLRMRPLDFPYRMLPVSHNRTFSYTNVYIRGASDIRQDHPEDLKGKRMGIADYQQSVGLWPWNGESTRRTWSGTRSEGRTSATQARRRRPGFPSLKRWNSTTPRRTSPLCTQTASSMRPSGWGQGMLRALTGHGWTSGTTRMSTHCLRTPKLKRSASSKSTASILPTMSQWSGRGILKEHPWIAVSLMEAFDGAKDIASQRLRSLPPTMMVFGQDYLQEVDSVFGPDPFVYGVNANAKAFEMAQTFSVEQGLSKRKQPWDEIFPQEVLYSEERH